MALLALPPLALIVWSQPPAPFEPRDRPLPEGPPLAPGSPGPPGSSASGSQSASGPLPERVVVLGTSLSARSDWPRALEAALTGCLGRPVSVEVVARPGATSAWGLAQVGRVAAMDPEVVIVELAVNDADILDGLRLDRSRAVHDTLLAEIAALAPGARVLLMTMNHARGPRGWARPRLAAYYAFYPRLAKRHGAGAPRPLPALAGAAARRRRADGRAAPDRCRGARGHPAAADGAADGGRLRLSAGREPSRAHAGFAPRRAA